MFIAIPRPAEHDDSLIFDMGEHGDGQTFHPWGPVSLWGPTETAVDSPESGFRVAAGDVRFLLAQANKNLNVNIDASDIVSLRCGIRPLAVKRGYSAGRHPLDCSRKHLVHHDRANAAIAIYGGKLTSCRELASEIMARLKAQLRPSGTPNSDCYTALQGADKLAPEPSWCRDNEGWAGTTATSTKCEPPHRRSKANGPTTRSRGIVPGSARNTMRFWRASESEIIG